MVDLARREVGGDDAVEEVPLDVRRRADGDGLRRTTDGQDKLRLGVEGKWERRTPREQWPEAAKKEDVVKKQV